jgi:hypothetical protein
LQSSSMDLAIRCAIGIAFIVGVFVVIAKAWE